MHPVRLFCRHFMAFPYLPEDFDDKYDNDWVTVPSSLWDRDRKCPANDSRCRGRIGEYRVFCLASLIGFEPSCLYNPRLR